MRGRIKIVSSAPIINQPKSNCGSHSHNGNMGAISNRGPDRTCQTCHVTATVKMPAATNSQR